MKLILIVAATAFVCHADTAYDWSFTPNPSISDVTGTIAGTVLLPNGDGMWSADSLTFTSLPAALNPMQGGAVTSWAHQVANQFEVVNGQIKMFQFFAVSTIINSNFSLVCMSNWLDSMGKQTNIVYDGAGAQCPTYNVVIENYFATAMNQYAQDQSDLFNDMFGPQGDPTSETPEPDSIWLMVATIALVPICAFLQFWRPTPKWLRDLRSHEWVGQRAAGDPAEEGSYEWVRYCKNCGMEDTCEDPMPPCPARRR
jgi:hypothetical protein